jgi:uncharacterized protein
MHPQPETLLEGEIESLKRFYEALNANDIDALVAAFDPEIVWIEPSDSPTGGTYRGLETVKAHFTQARARWAEGTCDAERFVACGDKVVVSIRVHVRLKDETEWREGRHASVFTFRDGKAVEQRIFDDEREALAWAGTPYR